MQKPSVPTGTKLFDAFLIASAVVIISLYYAF